jgi:hypothetical protein
VCDGSEEEQESRKVRKGVRAVRKAGKEMKTIK